MTEPDSAPKGSFFRHAATLLSGNIAARVLALALYPLLTRLYAPEVFGTFAVAESVLVMLASICHLRFPMAILLPSEREDVHGLALASLASTLFFALTAQAVVFFFAAPFASALRIADHSWLLHCIPALVLLSGLVMTLTQLNLRDKQFKGLALARIGVTGGERGLAVVLGLLAQATVFSLLLSKFAGLCLSGSILVRSIGFKQLPSLLSRKIWSRAKAMASRYRRFAYYSMTDLLHTGALQLPVLLLVAWFSPAAAGFFTLCRRILREPLNLLGQSLYRAYNERAAELLRNDQSPAEFTARIIGVLMDISLLPLLLVALAGPELFSLLFGARWAQAGAYATLLGGFYMINFLAMPLGALFDLKQCQHQRLWHDLLFLGAGSLGMTLGLLLGSPVWGVGLFSLFSALTFLARLASLTKLAGITGHSWWRTPLWRTLRALPLALPLIGAKIMHSAPWLVVLCMVLGMAVHLWQRAASDEMLREKLLQFVGKKG